MFVRPNSAEKQITGRVVGRDEWADALAPTRYNPATLVVVAAPHPIAREWRLVVSENHSVAASQYMGRGQIERAEGCPDEVRAFARSMLAEIAWRPDPIFTLDLCESNGHLFLVELNSFSCAGLYDCDLDAVVEFARTLAAR